MQIAIPLLVIVLTLAAIFVMYRRQTRYNLRQDHLSGTHYRPQREDFFDDDVRVITRETTPPEAKIAEEKPKMVTESAPVEEKPKLSTSMNELTLSLFLISEPGRPYIGYSLLQTILASGLRYGAMQIFHRHEQPHGKGRVLFSLANAEKPGTFDIHHMGTTRCHGLCFFMRVHPEPSEDQDPIQALQMMVETAQHLCDDLGGKLLDNHKQPFNERTLLRYQSEIEALGAVEA